MDNCPDNCNMKADGKCICPHFNEAFYSQGYKSGLLKAVEVIEGIDYTTWYETNYTQIAKVVIQKLEALIKEEK